MAAVAKGPYFRKIGKHTERFCRNANKKTQNVPHKRILFIAAISADDFFASLFGYSNKRPVAVFQQRTIRENIDSKQLANLLRNYLSVILALVSPYKGFMLQQAQLNETDFIKIWCQVFEYGPENRTLFDAQYLPAFQKDGLDGLIRTAGDQLVQELYAGADAMTEAERQVFQDVLIDDIAAILRSIDYKPEQ